MFTPIQSNEKLYKKVLFQIQTMLLNGELKPGDKLPPERQMADSLGVSRPALRQSLSILEALEIIECRQGDGNYVLPISNKLFNPIVLNYYYNSGNTNDILEMRYIIETQVIQILTRKVTHPQLQELDSIVSKMRDIHTLEERVELNNLFHYTLIKLAGNPLLSAVYYSILDLVGKQIMTTNGENFYANHKKLLDGIRSGDPQTACANMREHFQMKFPNFRYYDQL